MRHRAERSQRRAREAKERSRRPLSAADFEGNPTSISDDTVPANNRTYGYQDFQYFLTGGIGAWGNLAWTLDKIGNRLTETRGGLTDSYTYQLNGAGGRTAILQQITLGIGGSRNYLHGPAGHLELVTAGANEVDFITDAAGRLARLERAAGDAAADFTYDGRSFLASSLTDTVNLFTDGFESGDTRCWSETVGAPNAPENCSPQPETLPVYSSEGLLHALRRNPGQSDETRRSTFYFAGRPVAELDLTPLGAETLHWLTTDHLGTPVLATSSAGNEIWRGGFEPFGQEFNGASANGLDLRFPGQWSDASWWSASQGSQVLFNVYRWYVPAIGQYSRPDPVNVPALLLRRRLRPRDGPGVTPGAGGEAIVPYNYTAGNPVANADPFGLAIVSFSGCTGAQQQQIEAAAEAADAASEHSCFCGYPRGEFRRRIRDLRVKCVPWTREPFTKIDACGAAAEWDPVLQAVAHFKDTIILTPAAFRDPRCGCLQGTVMHEVLHLAGRSHDDGAGGFYATRRCFSCS